MEKAVAEGEREQEKGMAEAGCGAGCFPKKLSLLGQYKIIPGSW